MIVYYDFGVNIRINLNWGNIELPRCELCDCTSCNFRREWQHDNHWHHCGLIFISIWFHKNIMLMQLHKSLPSTPRCSFWWYLRAGVFQNVIYATKLRTQSSSPFHSYFSGVLILNVCFGNCKWGVVVVVTHTIIREDYKRHSFPLTGVKGPFGVSCCWCCCLNWTKCRVGACERLALSPDTHLK